MQVLLGLGGNVGDVAAAFARAAGQLAARFTVSGRSSLWRTAPQGPPQPDFLNAALLLDVDVHPLQVLAVCRGLEADAGRARDVEQPWGPRPLDLDVLMAPVIVEGPHLTLPHPQLALRRFALEPACELAASWRHPHLRRTLAEIAAGLAASGQRCDRVGSFPGA